METVRLNLGCGDKYWPGFTNIDAYTSCDVNAELTDIPYQDNSVDLICSIHSLEHLHRLDADKALREWFRVLKSGGKVVIELPSLDKIAKSIVDGQKNFVMTLFGLFGDPRTERPEMLHKWCYSKKELTQALGMAGFKEVVVEEPFFHFEERDMRVTAVKP